MGEPYFDGPTFCLSRYRLTHSEDGHEKKGIEVFFSKSRYANNVTAKSTSAINLRKKALREFQHLDQPIEWLASGVGVAVVVFCDDGTHFVTCQRSDTERFRSREFDISVVEGINPVKDRHPEKTDRVYIHDAVKRAVHAELGFKPEDDEINVIGFGVDLEYYQWNFIAYVESSLSFQEIELAWQTADEKFETMALSYVSATPEDAAEFAAVNPVWSSGLAALYTSLFKRSPVPQQVRSAFIGAFEKKYS